MINLIKKLKSKLSQKKIKYQFEGPFDSSYSLAILNKNAALTFDKHFPKQVSLYSLEGGGDIEPNRDFLEANTKVKKLFDKSQKAIKAEVTLRNCYPPTTTGMKSKINIFNSYGWEESAFPKEYVKSFNQNLTGIIAVSHYVKKVLITNGVSIPIKVINNPVDHMLHITPKPYKLKTTKTFRFLHISSCFPRKGVDILLEAYAKAFTSDDDVVLIIKTFPNPHNNIEEQIANIQKTFPNPPQIEVINKDLDETQIAWLYKNSDTLVAPSRGEGFGLPMAEAMLFDLPVITTGFGGQADFCAQKTSWLIDYTFQRAKTHINLFDSYWIEPKIDSLKHLLQEQTKLTTAQKKQKTHRAKQIVSQEFTWDNYLNKTVSFIKELKTKKSRVKKVKKIAWISSYNTKCGIATYTDFLLKYFDTYSITIYANYAKDIVSKTKESNTIRCWKDRFDANNDELIKKVLSSKTTHAVLNFNFAFFSMKNLEEILHTFYKNNIKTTIIFHSVEDVTIKGLEASLSHIKQTLQNSNSLLVHSIKDLNVLKSFGLVDNVSLLPHGIKSRKQNTRTKQNTQFTIASYGFLLPQKGIKELIVAFSLLQKSIPHAKLLLLNALYPAKISNDYLKLCTNTIKKYNLQDKVELITDFLSDESSLSFLDKADIIVMPYRQTNESSSAAVRYALCTHKPVLCTKQPIFDDVSDIVHFCEGFLPEDLAHSILTLKKDNKLLLSKSFKQTKWIKEHSWNVVSKTLQCIITNLQ